MQRRKTGEQAIRNGEGPDFIRAELEDCDYEGYVYMYQKGSKTCISVTSKDKKEEVSTCI